jgi:hypothetical protein
VPQRNLGKRGLARGVEISAMVAVDQELDARAHRGQAKADRWGGARRARASERADRAR